MRPPTGLDPAARAILLRMLRDAGVGPMRLHNVFFREEHYADLADYVRAIGSVWGKDDALKMLDIVEAPDGFSVVPGQLHVYFLFEGQPARYSADSFLHAMAEPDFLTCIEIGHQLVQDMEARSNFPDAVTRLCQKRGIPYSMRESMSGAQFVWTGDPTVEEEALQPALSALGDPRLAVGPGQEFATARLELREGTPGDLKQAVAEACNAVESALKVLLVEHGAAVPASQNVNQLLAACKVANLFPPAVDGKGVPVEQILLGPARFGNRRGRRGGGPVPHNVEREEAEAVVAAAAVAIAFIAKRLPEQARPNP